jgi:hypothetical protein
MPDELNEQDVERILDALDDAQHPRPWPGAMQLPAVLDELRLWLDDDRQWLSASPKNWQSLLQELERAVASQPEPLLRLVGDPAHLRAEVAAFSTAQKDPKHRSELTQRKRLERFLADVRERLQSSRAVEVAWDCLLETKADARDAAERFLAFARWAGHDAKRLREAIDRDLAWWGRTSPAPPIAERFERVHGRLRAAAASGDVVVWLLLKYGRVGEPSALPVGPNVMLYDADWLADAIKDRVASLPDELKSDLGADRVETLALDAERTELGVPDAVIRVFVADVLRADAVTVARHTAATIGAFGTLYGGAKPSLWQVDPSFVTFHDRQAGPTSYRASDVGSPSITETVGISHDQTANALDREGDRLGRHLPVRGGQMARVAQILRWLRDARVSPPPARLALCARAIEVVSAWAGFATPDRFVAQHLARSWAWSRVRSALDDVAVQIIFGEELAHAPIDAPEKKLWHQLMADPQLGLSQTDHGGYRYDHAEMVRRLDWLGEMLPAGSAASKHLQRVAHRFASPSATLAWYDALYRQAMDNESRRTRTRNAIMHGGPLADETIETVVPFAVYMASEAVDVALEAHLRDADVADFVVERGARFDAYRQRLKSKELPADVLFVEIA